MPKPSHVRRPWRPRSLLAAALLCLCQACGSDSPAPPPPANPPPPAPPPPAFSSATTFADVTALSGLAHVFSLANPMATSDPAQMGGGVAAADIDADGDIDLYLVGGDGEANALFRNDGGNRFTETSVTANLAAMHMGSGPAFADIDGDNDLDLFVGAVEGDSVYLFRNDGNVFTDVTPNSGIVVTADNTISATFGDYDRDGDLDLFLAHWGNAPQPDTENLWQNNGDGTFVSASIPSRIAEQIIGPAGGLSGLFDYSFAGIFSDIDRDGDPDLLLASDFRTSKVFRNRGDGTFEDISDRDVITDRNGMGNAVGDYDNDGDMDWFVTSIYEDGGGPDPNIGNRLYRNLGDGTFEDATGEAGVANGGWGWGACMEDFDNDGDLDILHVNGWNQVDPRDASGPNDYTADQVRYFESQGDGTFVEAAESARLTDTGQGRGLVCFDADRDGDIDALITNNEDSRSVVFYRNELAAGNHYLTVRLAGQGMNTRGIGAWIQVEDGARTQVREIRAGNHFVSQGPAEAHFGLGLQTSAEVTVTWPSGAQVTQTVAADQLLVIAEP